MTPPHAHLWPHGPFSLRNMAWIFSLCPEIPGSPLALSFPEASQPLQGGLKIAGDNFGRLWISGTFGKVGLFPPCKRKLRISGENPLWQENITFNVPDLLLFCSELKVPFTRTHCHISNSFWSRRPASTLSISWPFLFSCSAVVEIENTAVASLFLLLLKRSVRLQVTGSPKMISWTCLLKLLKSAAHFSAAL